MTFAHSLSKFTQHLLATLLILSSLLNVAFIVRFRSMDQRIRQLRSEQRLLEGVLLPSISGSDAHGKHMTVKYETPSAEGKQVPTLIYVYKNDCSWCQRNVVSFGKLVTALKRDHRILCLSLSKDTASVAMNDVTARICPTVLFPDPDIVISYKLGSTPQTLLIAHDGRLKRNWIGAYTGSTKDEIESLTGLALPSLQPNSANMELN